MSEYDKEPLSRVEEILDEASSGTEYDKEPLSRVEFRLKEVMAKIDGLVPDATVYKAGGSVTFTNLPTPSKSTLGYVYDVSDAFTTTSDFKEGSGKKYPAGTNVAIVDIGTDENPIYKYDVLSGFIDMDNYVEKEAGKGLSSNDFTNEAKNKLDDLENYDDTEIKNDISDLSDAVEDKVDKVAGKGLSTNDFTDAAKNKLDDLENYDDTNIRNDILGLKTGKVDKDGNKVLSTNDFDNEAKNVVDNSLAVVASTSSPISTLDDRIKSLTIYGKSEIVDGAIKSAGDSGSIEIETCEKNLLDPTKLVTENITYTDGTLSGMAVSFHNEYKYGIPILFSKTRQITFSAKIYTNGKIPDGNGLEVLFVYKDGTSNILIVPNNTTQPQTFTLTSNAAKQVQYIGISFGSEGGNIWYLSEIQLEYGSTATAYEPYNGTMATFTTGTPLRGIPDGAKDVEEWDGTSGEVTKNCGVITLNGSETWYVWTGTAFYCNLTMTKAVTVTNDQLPHLLSYLSAQTATDIFEQNVIGINVSNNTIRIRIENINNTSDLQAYLQANPLTIVYELATPTSLPLTTAELTALSSLKTYSPQTTITINDNPEFEIEAYANTANGKAMQELEKKITTDYVSDAELTDILDGYVEAENGKGLSTNDYTDADKALVQDSPITVTATASPISTANGKPRKLKIYGKSEVVDGVIKSAGEGWSTVDLGTLDYVSDLDIGQYGRFYTPALANVIQKVNGSLLCSIFNQAISLTDVTSHESGYMFLSELGNISFSRNGHETDTAFKAAMSGVILAYKEATPTNNTIAVKTDDGTGINGTMATFTTGTPLYGVSADTRDFMEWDGLSGEVTKKCGAVDLGTLNDWSLQSAFNIFSAPISNIYRPTSQADRNHLLCSKYASYAGTIDDQMVDKTVSTANGNVYIKDEDYTTVTDFIASLGDAELVYELATPTTEQLTQTENESLSTLKTYSPQTTITINDSPDFKIEAYANTANGQAISDMQPTRSPLLTLTASGWTNNAQTVTFAHDIGKRNSIDVEPANIKAWTAAGILATSETTTSITFECDTVPTADLSFRVTSMEVR